MEIIILKNYHGLVKGQKINASVQNAKHLINIEVAKAAKATAKK